MQLCVACNKMVSIGETSCRCGHVLREALTIKEEHSSRKRRAVFRPNSVSSEWISIKEKSELKLALKKSKLENGYQNGHNVRRKDENDVTTLQNKSTTNNKNHTVNTQISDDNNNNNYNNTTAPRPVGRPRKNGSASFNNRKKLTKPSSNGSGSILSSTAPMSNNGNCHHYSTTVSKNINHNSKAKVEEVTGKQNKLKELLEMIENSYQNIYFNKCKSYKKAKLSDLDFEFDFSSFESHSPFYPSALEDINTKINKTNSFWRSLR